MKGKISLVFEKGCFSVVEHMEGQQPKTLYSGSNIAIAKKVFDETVKGSGNSQQSQAL